MNLAGAIAISAGGQGSGCQGSNCGRPKILYHVTDEKNLAGILKNGLQTQKTGAPKTNSEFGSAHDKNAVYSLTSPKDFSTVIGNKLDFGEMEHGREDSQVLIHFRPVGDVVDDKETTDEETGKSWGVKHVGAIPAKNIIGYQRIGKVRTNGYPTKVSAKLAPLKRSR